MNREIIRARDMASALELAERKLGADVLIVKSSDLGGHVEIEVERGKPIKDKKIKNFDSHLKSNMKLSNDKEYNNEVTTQTFLTEKNIETEVLKNKDNVHINSYNENKYF